jgi:hypothetical protein
MASLEELRGLAGGAGRHELVAHLGCIAVSELSQ